MTLMKVKHFSRHTRRSMVTALSIHYLLSNAQLLLWIILNQNYLESNNSTQSVSCDFSEEEWAQIVEAQGYLQRRLSPLSMKKADALRVKTKVENVKVALNFEEFTDTTSSETIYKQLVDDSWICQPCACASATIPGMDLETESSIAPPRSSSSTVQLPAEADESSQLPTAKSSPSCNADVDMHQDDDDNVDFGNGIDHSMFEDDETEDDVEEAAEIETSTVDLQVPVPLSSEQCHTSSIKPVVSSSEQRQSPVKTISQTVELDLT